LAGYFAVVKAAWRLPARRNARSSPFNNSKKAFFEPPYVIVIAPRRDSSR